MPVPVDKAVEIVRETAYFIWEREGRPDGHALEHWERARAKVFGSDPSGHDDMPDEEKVLSGRPDANMPALLTKDVLGG